MKKKWWHDKAAYQIYPKSFLDTNGDGIGDLRGIISKLDYLKDLGSTLSGFPRSISPRLWIRDTIFLTITRSRKNSARWRSSMSCLAETKKRGMYVLMDLEVNHCSDKHEWFQKALKDPYGKYAGYFHFVKGKDGKEPSNYRSYFGGSAWEPVPGTDLYYLHMFAKEQPDLNWRIRN